MNLEKFYLGQELFLVSDSDDYKLSKLEICSVEKIHTSKLSDSFVVHINKKGDLFCLNKSFFILKDNEIYENDTYGAKFFNFFFSQLEAEKYRAHTKISYLKKRIEEKNKEILKAWEEIRQLNNLI